LRTHSGPTAPAAHSWRTLWGQNGRPFRLDGVHPWARTPALARELFDAYEAAGVYQRNSNVVRDQVVPGHRERSMVDTSEWLFKTCFARDLEFQRTYSADDWVTSRAEDSKLLDQIVLIGHDIPSTRKPTIRYFMGGYSNAQCGEGTSASEWVVKA
jgi:hypothetical protein